MKIKLFYQLINLNNKMIMCFRFKFKLKLDDKKRCTVQIYRNKVNLDLREYYEKDGK